MRVLSASMSVHGRNDTTTCFFPVQWRRKCDNSVTHLKDKHMQSVSSSESTNTALDSITSRGEHIQRHTALTAVSCCILSSQMICCVMSTSAGPTNTALVSSVTSPRASKSSDVQHRRLVVLQQVRWYAGSCPVSVPTPNVHGVVSLSANVHTMAQPSVTCPSNELIEIQLRWHQLEYTSFSKCIGSTTCSIQRVQGRDSTGDNGRSKAGNQSSMPENPLPLGLFWSCFYPTYFFLGIWLWSWLCTGSFTFIFFCFPH